MSAAAGLANESRPVEREPADACGLLSEAQITAVLGLPATAGRRDDSGYVAGGAYSSTCLWVIESEVRAADPEAPLGGRSFVILNVMSWPEGSGGAHSFLQAFHDAAAKGDIPQQPVARDLGDEALWWGDGLAVRRRDVSFGISVFVPALAPPSPGYYEEQLAARILARIENGGVTKAAN